MFRYAFLIEYEGTHLAGWQEQPGLSTVQGFLETAAQKLSLEKVTFYAAGRTDAGVHALGQVAHGVFSKSWSLDNLRRGLNFYLKKTPVRVLDVGSVEATFHARFSALQRHYIYKILSRPSPSVLRENRLWWTPQVLDLLSMEQGLSFLQGTHDFERFRSAFCQASSSLRTLDEARLSVQDDEIHIFFKARSFLHHQVRMMTGAVVQLGLGRFSMAQFRSYLLSPQDKPRAFTAPAQGLYFQSVDYSRPVFPLEKGSVL